MELERDTQHCDLCGGGPLSTVDVRRTLRYVVCRACGHCAQALSSAAQREAFSEAQSRCYNSGESDAQVHFPEALEGETLNCRIRMLRKWLAPAAHVLEIGPGSGRLMQWMFEQGFKVSGVEESQNLRDLLPAALRSLVTVGEFESAPLPLNTMDAVCSFHVIEHVPDPMAHLARALALTKPNGLGFIATPNARSWHQRLLGSHSIHFSAAHLRVFSAKSLATLCHAAGWEVVAVTTPAHSNAWFRTAAKGLRLLKGEDQDATAGRYGFQPSRRMRVAIQVARFLSLPVRWIQSLCGGGNEIVIVLRHPTK